MDDLHHESSKRVPLAPCPRTPGLSRICFRLSEARNPRANHPHPNGLQGGGRTLAVLRWETRYAGSTVERIEVEFDTSCLNTTPQHFVTMVLIGGPLGIS